jgi:hypothetical protein
VRVAGPPIDRLLATHSYYIASVIPGGMYAGNPDDVPTIGTQAASRALAWPDAKPMEMWPMEGYVFVDPPPHDERTLRDWLELGVAFVNTFAAKASAVDAPADQDRDADQRAAVSVRGARPVYRFGFSAELSTRFTKD